MYGKKAQTPINGVFLALMGAALAFLVLVIALSLIGQILGTQEGIQLASAITATTNNETLTANVTLANAITLTLDDNIANSTVQVLSGDNQLTEGVNYSLTAGGVFTTLSTGTDLAWNISYNYTIIATTIASNVSLSGLTATGNISDLVPTMGLLIGIIALLSLLAVLAALFVGRTFGGNLES